MPRFISPLGISCTADEAKPGGRLRDGYREIVGPGEYQAFDITMIDSAPARSGSVYFTDGDSNYTQMRDQQDRTVRDAIRGAHYGDLSAGAAANDAAYERSKTALNDWRKDTAKSAETVAAIRDAHWL